MMVGSFKINRFLKKPYIHMASLGFTIELTKYFSNYSGKNCTENGPSWKADSHTANAEVPYFL
jgi:hypothetical protein